ncbi:MAG: chloride channel protein [Flavobacteriales bacterium]|nr:chloride channel protein [Flavobacteriales bacterium]
MDKMLRILSIVFSNFFAWRQKHIKHRHFVLILSAIVGVLSGLVAIFIRNAVHLVEWLLKRNFINDYHNYLFFIYPLIGILLTIIIVKYLLRSPVEHGIPNALHAISQRNSKIKKKSMYSSILTSVLTVGFGGSVGLEGPTVGTSTAIGSNLGQWARLNYKTKTLLIGCAASGALASIFQAPIAAIVFAIEVMMLDLTMSSMIPLLVASVSAALTSTLIEGDRLLFKFPMEKFTAMDLPFYILLGIGTGICSIYFTKTFLYIHKLFDNQKDIFLRAIIGGSLLGILIFFIPPLYGEGYDTINSIIEGRYTDIFEFSVFYGFKDNIFLVLVFLFMIVFFKTIATSLTFGAGGVGGIFAPSLFMGSTVGFTCAKMYNSFGFNQLSESNFTLVGMAGVMAGVLHAPLTAIFLIAEITGGYELFIPLMVCASIAYLTVKITVPHSVYTMQLAERGELITHDKDQAVLSLMNLEAEIERDFQTVSADMKLGELIHVIAESDRNIYPVLDNDLALIGLVRLNKIRNIMFKSELHETTFVHEVMSPIEDSVGLHENMDNVMRKFDKIEIWNLPVIADGKYVGFVSKSKLFTAYRKLLKEFYEE